MLILQSTDKLRLITVSAGSINVHASWLDNVAGAVNPGRTNTPAIATATTTDIVPSPASGVFRNIKSLHVNNHAATPNTVAVIHTDGTTAVELHRAALAPSETLQYVDEVGFITSASSGFVTGDVKLTYKTVADAGWVLMNDGAIGSAASGSSSRANGDTEALFTLLYNNIIDTWAPIMTSAGVPTSRAAQGTAAQAFAANCRLALPRVLGRCLSSAGPGVGLTFRQLGSLAGAEVYSQVLANMPPHNHVNTPFFSTWDNGSLGGMWGGGGLQVGTMLATDGASAPQTIMSPASYLNVVVKL